MLSRRAIRERERLRLTMRFPYRGVDAAAPIGSMPENACPDMLNMFPRAQTAGSSDVSGRRYGGGKRPGMTKSGVFPGTGPARVLGLMPWDASASVGQVVIAQGAAAATFYYVAAPYTGSWLAVSFGTAPGDLTRPTSAIVGQTMYVVGIGNNLIPKLTASGGAITGSAFDVSSFFAAPSLCCAYRTCLVLARSIQATTSDFVMSKVGAPETFNFSGTSTNDAYNGNATGFAGVPGDRITALIPFGDEYLVFGASTSMWKLTGHPRFGGRVDLLTQRVGVLDRHSWCFDPQGTLWFIGSDFGLYRLPRGSFDPQEVLKGRAETWIGSVLRGQTAKTAHLVYDTDTQMVLVLIVPTSQAATPASAETHIAYSPMLDGLYPFSFPVGVPPFCAASEDGGRVFFGGAETAGSGASRPVGIWVPGSQKVQDWNTNTDAEANFDCRIRFAPVSPGSGRWMARRLRAIGGHNTGACPWYWLGGESPDEVQRQSYAGAGVARASGTFFSAASGFQQPVGIRVTARAHQLVIAQSANADLRLDEFMADLEYAGQERSGA